MPEPARVQGEEQRLQPIGTSLNLVVPNIKLMHDSSAVSPQYRTSSPLAAALELIVTFSLPAKTCSTTTGSVVLLLTGVFPLLQAVASAA